MLAELSKLRDGRSKRISSYDVTGANNDWWKIDAGETSEIARITGPGCIRHIWITVWSKDPYYPRTTILRCYWDGEESPSVDTPLGDFFGVGHGAVTSYSCAVFNMSKTSHPSLQHHAGMNCWFPMPFSEEARIEIINESEQPIGLFYFYIDYDELTAPPDDHGRFHAKWRREDPTDGWVPLQPEAQPDDWRTGEGKDALNLTDSENYLLLDARGHGHFVGVNLSIHNLTGGWWGEGDDMFMIDGKKWPPDLHGTGSEDYFGHAWGMQTENAFPYNGVSYHKPGSVFEYNERITVYRYHVPDPIIFQESLRASIEHGHANTHSNDYSSTVYWYQTEPHYDFCPMLPVAERVPRPDIQLKHIESPGPSRLITASKRRMERGVQGNQKRKGRNG